MTENHTVDTNGQTELMNWVCHNIPFMALVAKNAPANRPFTTRLVEHFATAIIAAAVGLYVNDKIQDDKLGTLARTLDESTSRLEQHIQILDQRIFELQNERARKPISSYSLPKD